MEEVMRCAVQRVFRVHGCLCAQRPWEVMFLVITATAAMLTGGEWGSAPECVEGGQYSSVSTEPAGVDVVVMTVLRCGALLYTYHQFKLLRRRGSKCILGIAVLFVVFSSLVFSCAMVKVLGSPVSDLKDAVFFFLLVIDISKLSRLSAPALAVPTRAAAAATIAEGLASLGPGLTLDTCVEALLVGAGSLSGMRRLEQICQFAVLSIIVNYLVLMTFFPACLSLVLQMSSDRRSSSPEPASSATASITPTHPTRVRRSTTPDTNSHKLETGSSGGLPSMPGNSVWQLGYSMHCAAAIMGEETTHNPVLQKVKVIMSAGLVLVHGISRFSVVLPDDQPGLLHTHNTSDSRARPHLAFRWLNDGLEQVVVLVLVVALLIKYVMFEGNVDMDLQLRPTQHGGDPDAGSPTKCPTDLSVCTEQQDCASTLLSATPTAPSAAVLVSRVDSSTQTDVLTHESASSTAPYLSVTPLATAAVATDSSLSSTTTDALKRSVEECVRPLSVTDGVKQLKDDEVAELVKSKHLSGYKLESVLQDCVRGVHVRRLALAPHSVCPDAMAGLPYRNFDYSKVVGVCCENVLGYVSVPVGVAGPLSINGKSFLIPMATTEGCLVASTNRGCCALQQSREGGVTSRVFRDGMTRAPVVKFPSVQRSVELYQWLQVPSNKAMLKEAFDSTSSFARMKDVTPKVVGRKMHLRFVATTGDAMGMNMVSKGVEAALRLLREHFPDMQVLSISGNVCTDKKPSAVNWIEGRGKSVVCGALVPGSVVRSVLKTTVAALVERHVAKNLEGSAVAGSVGGSNAHAANIVAALFIACGQDPAQVVGSSNCITQLEAQGEDLFASVTLPSLEVGTVGGGTALPAQAACLQLLGVKGSHPTQPGENAEQLSRIVAGAVLAGELSLMAALCVGDLVSSHMKLNRAKTSEPVQTNSCRSRDASEAAADGVHEESVRAAPHTTSGEAALDADHSLSLTPGNTSNSSTFISHVSDGCMNKTSDNITRNADDAPKPSEKIIINSVDATTS